MPVSNYLPSSRISQAAVCTSTTRPATPYEGQLIYESDTDNLLVWSGVSWVGIQSSSLTVGSSNVAGTTYSQIYVNATSQTGAGITLQPAGSGSIPWSIISAGPNATQGAGSLLVYRNNSDTSSASLKLDSSGRMTTPYQPSFSMNKGANQTLTSDSTTLQFTTTNWNIGNHYNTSTYTFTAPVTGIYFFALNVRYDSMSTATYHRASIVKNGTTAWEAPNHMNIDGAASTNYQSFSPSGFHYLVAGDTVQARGGPNSGSCTLQSESTFSGMLIG